MSSLTHEINITFADADGDVSTRTYELANSVAITDVPLVAAALMDLYEPVINGTILSASYTIAVAVPALVASALSDVQEIWVVGLRSVTNFFKRFTIPTVLESKVFVPLTKDADITDADVLAIHTAFVNGIDVSGAGGSGVVEFSDNHGADLDTLEYSREEFTR